MWEHDGDYLTAHTMDGLMEIRPVEEGPHEKEPNALYHIYDEGYPVEGDYTLDDAITSIEESYAPEKQPPGMFREYDFIEPTQITRKDMNERLQKLGFDGITYDGGKIVGIYGLHKVAAFKPEITRTNRRRNMPAESQAQREWAFGVKGRRGAAITRQPAPAR
jgi:hypothetical protein